MATYKPKPKTKKVPTYTEWVKLQKQSKTKPVAYKKSYPAKGGYQKKSYSNTGYYKKPTYKKSAPDKKYSGCQKETVTGRTDGVQKLVINGWLKTRNSEMISYVAVPSKAHLSSNDKLKMTVKVKQGISENLFWGTWDKASGIFYIQGLNIIGMPKRNSSFYYKKR